MMGGNFLSQELTPESFSYNTWNYFVDVTFFSFLELNYRCILFKTSYMSREPKFNQQDRSLTARLRPIKESKCMPAIVIGTNDPFNDYGTNYFATVYGVATKNFLIGGHKIGIGVQAEMKFRTDNGRWELGALAGSTGYSAVTKEDGWYIGRKQRINAAVKATYYEPYFNLQMDLQAGRYIYGDYGVRGDCTRHFGEYAIGMYAICIEGEINGGFHFAIPLPGKKWERNHAVRVRPGGYFAEEYSMRS